MNEDIICKVCNYDDCWQDEERTALLNEWLQPFTSHYKLDLTGLHSFAFTPKLAVGNYGAEFLRRKNGESVILVSEELWNKSKENVNDLRMLLNVLQHELAHVHNNNCLAELPGKIFLADSEESEDISIFIYRLWDEFFSTQLAAYCEPLSLLQAKITGVLVEKEQLKIVMRDSAGKNKARRDQQDMLFLTATHLAGSYFGNEDLREHIMEGSLKKDGILSTVWEISEAAGSLLSVYPFESHEDLLPLAQVYSSFLQEADILYSPLWRRLLSQNRTQKTLIYDG